MWTDGARSIFLFNNLERDRFVARWAAELPAGSAVLDVGAGPCRYRSLFSHCWYVAQDFSGHVGSREGPMAEGDAWGYGELDVVSDAAALPLRTASVDAVLCTEVIEHVLDPKGVVEELGRVLRPGGRLLLTAPLGSGLHQEPHHYYGGYTPYWYESVLDIAGFETPTIVANGGFFKHYGQESQRFSAMIDPRRLNGFMRWIVAPLWLITLPWFRLVVPVACHYLDRLDMHKGFTVGYHVTAVRANGRG